MADIKLDPNEIKEKLEPVGDAVVKAGKAIAKKAEPAVKAVGEKAKEGQKKVEEKAREAGKAAGDRVRETRGKAQAKGKQAGRKASSPVMPVLYVQYRDKEYACDELVSRAQADYHEKNKAAIRSCKLYIKPEENAAYYVISGKEGKISLE